MDIFTAIYIIFAISLSCENKSLVKMKMSENKDTDQLCGSREADLPFVFAYAEISFSYDVFCLSHQLIH